MDPKTLGTTIVKFIIHPGESRNDLPLGGKAKALAALDGKGLFIPDWFVVLPEA